MKTEIHHQLRLQSETSIVTEFLGAEKMYFLEQTHTHIYIYLLNDNKFTDLNDDTMKNITSFLCHCLH